MRFTHWSWSGVCALCLATACAGPTVSSSETETTRDSMLTTGPNQANSAALVIHGVHRSRKDPNANAHPTGRREAGAKDHLRVANEAKKVVGVRPTQLAVDRLRAESVTQAAAPRAKTARASGATSSAVGDSVVPFGSDLITVAPGSDERVAAPSALSSLPRAVDNSALPAFPEIRNQGALNTCVAFAVGYYQYTYTLGRLAGWDNKNATDAHKVSPKWLYNLVNGGSDSGTSPYFVHAILKEHGALNWSEFPYAGDLWNPMNYREWPTTAAVWESALKYKSLGFAWVDSPSTPEGLARVKSLLANGQVLTFDTFIYSWEFDALDDDPNTSADDAFVGQRIATWMNGDEGSHEATIVGYDDDLWVDINSDGVVDPGEKGAFKIANSWGPEWQNGGYAWVAYDALQWRSQVPNAPTSPLRSGIMGQIWALAGARVDYQPNLLAEFTASTAARGDLSIIAGLAEPERGDIVERYEPPAFTGNGGPLAYDGSATSTGKSGTFAIDLSDLALSYADVSYLLRAQNSSAIAASLSDLTLIDRLKNHRRTVTRDPARTIGQNETKTQSLRYEFRDWAQVPRLSLTPTNHVAFGSLTLGESAKRTITAQNTGSGDLMITALRFSNPLFSSLTPSTFRLAPGESSAIDLEFAPAASQHEFALLTVHNTSTNLRHPSFFLSGNATSNDDHAPYQLFITGENPVHDDSVALRVELKSKVRTSTRLSDFQVVYYLNDPGFDPTAVQWDLHDTNSGPVTASVKQLFLTRQLGVRTASWSVTFRFAPGTTLAAGASAIFQGSLSVPDHSWHPDESDDWSRYRRCDGMAEGAVIQNVATRQVVFGLPAEAVPGGYQLSIAPRAADGETEASASFTVSDPNQLGAEFALYVYSSRGETEQIAWAYPDTLGAQSVVIPLVDQGQFPLKPGTYTVVLEIGGVRVDAAEFTKE